MRPYPEVPTKKLLLWLLIAFTATFLTLWLSDSLPSAEMFMEEQKGSETFSKIDL